MFFLHFFFFFDIFSITSREPPKLGPRATSGCGPRFGHPCSRVSSETYLGFRLVVLYTALPFDISPPSVLRNILTPCSPKCSVFHHFPPKCHAPVLLSFVPDLRPDPSAIRTFTMPHVLQNAFSEMVCPCPPTFLAPPPLLRNILPLPLRPSSSGPSPCSPKWSAPCPNVSCPSLLQNAMPLPLTHSSSAPSPCSPKCSAHPALLTIFLPPLL